MQSAVTTAAGALARDLLAIRDRSERMEAVAGVCAVLADALEGSDAHTPLDEAASNARAESELWARQREAEVANRINVQRRIAASAWAPRVTP